MSGNEPRDAIGQGYYWASRVTTVALMFVLPALGGLWLDGRWPLRPLGVIAGAALGFAAGMAYLLRMAADSNRQSGKK